MSRSKLKWNKAQLLAVAGFAFLVSFILEKQFLGTSYALWVWGAIYIIWGCAWWFRTRLFFYPVFGLVCGLAAWHYELATHGHTVLSMPTFVAHLSFNIALLVLWGGKTFVWQSTLEESARRIFEKAADNVKETANGFTDRPYVIDKLDYSNKDIQAFAGFLDKKRTTKSLSQPDKTILLFSLTISPLSFPSLDKVSYVSFAHDGQVTAHISKSDYSQYKAQFTFDQLCHGLGQVFKIMFEFYQNGEREKALDWLKA